MAPVLAVRETSVSRHHGDPIEGPPETPRTSQPPVLTVRETGVSRHHGHDHGHAQAHPANSAQTVSLDDYIS